MLAAPSPKPESVTSEALAEPPHVEPTETSATPATQDNSPPAEKPDEKPTEPAVILPPPAAPIPAPTPVEAAPPPESAAVAPAPLFRARADLAKPAAAPIPAVIPILRAPDDPGIDDEGPTDEFTEQIGTPKAQAGGWRGFWARWAG